MQPKECEDSLRSGAVALSPFKLAHVVCLTAKLAEMKQWYMTVLSAKVAFANDMLCFLRYDDEHHRIGLIRFDGLQPMPAGPVSAIDHFSFTYRSLPELLGTYLRLKDEGIAPFWTINHGPTTSFYYKDPDGHKVELQVDNLTEAECDAFFAAGNYEENPIGINIVPEEWIARYGEGEPISSITTRPKLPAGVSPFDMIRY